MSFIGLRWLSVCPFFWELFHYCWATTKIAKKIHLNVIFDLRLFRGFSERLLFLLHQMSISITFLCQWILCVEMFDVMFNVNFIVLQTHFVKSFVDGFSVMTFFLWGCFEKKRFNKIWFSRGNYVSNTSIIYGSWRHEWRHGQRMKAIGTV